MIKKYFLLFSFLLMTLPSYASETQNVQIKDEKGKTFGKLKLSTDGKSLSIIQNNGLETEIASCVDEVKKQVLSPNQLLTAIFVERNCGATVDFASRLILKSPKEQTVIAIFEGKQTIEFTWKSNQKLEVNHSKLQANQIYLQRNQKNKVLLSFIPAFDSVEPSKYIDFASYNYGATGRASGLPKELLLRIAGWSQEASGLYKDDWGYWFSATPPYGDDPRGHINVKKGISYYENEYQQENQ